MNLVLGYHALSSGARTQGAGQPEHFGFAVTGPGTSISMCAGHGWPVEGGRVPITVQSQL